MYKPIVAIIVAVLSVGFVIFSAGAYADQGAELIKASWKGDWKQVQEVINLGANVNSKGRDGTTALMIASGKGCPDVVNLLLAKGAKVDAKNEDGKTPLIRAASGLISSAWKRNCQCVEGNCIWGYTEVAKLLLHKGADVNAKSKDGDTALMAASRWAASEMVALFLENGAELNPKDKDGQTALMMAARDGNPDVVKLLLDRGSDVNARDKESRTPLMVAAGQSPAGKAEVVKMLLDAGADVNAEDKNGQTALLMAAGMSGDTRVLKQLLETGADVNATDKAGMTALMGVLELFRSASIYSTEESQSGWTSLNTQETRRTAVFHDAKLKFYGSPVLSEEDRGRCKELIESLLEKGADVNARDKDGRTALMRGLEPSIEVVADSVTQSEDKGTALTLKIKNGTVRIKRNLPTEIVELLKAHGAKE